MPGADSAGYAGLNDQVTTIISARLPRHSSCLALQQASLQSAAANRRNFANCQQRISEALGQQLGQVTAQLIAKTTTPPTL